MVLYTLIDDAIAYLYRLPFLQCRIVLLGWERYWWMWVELRWIRSFSRSRYITYPNPSTLLQITPLCVHNNHIWLCDNRPTLRRLVCSVPVVAMCPNCANWPCHDRNSRNSRDELHNCRTNVWPMYHCSSSSSTSADQHHGTWHKASAMRRTYRSNHLISTYRHTGVVFQDGILSSKHTDVNIVLWHYVKRADSIVTNDLIRRSLPVAPVGSGTPAALWRITYGT